MVRQALVTGGAGFIGSHLVDLLIRSGWNVRVLDNLSSGTHANLQATHGDIEFIEGDVRDEAACRRACRGVDCVFHLAAIASVIRSVENPMLTHDVTLGGTLNMLLAAREQNVRRFVFSSSASVYGNATVVPTDEKQPLQPMSPYATAKAAGEFYCQNFWGLFGLETVILRYFNVFGPRQSAFSDYAAVVPVFINAALAGKTPLIYGDGLQTRDFVAVENVVAANLLAADAAAAGHAVNIGSGLAISLLDLIAELETNLGKKLNPIFQPAREGEVRHSRADISCAERVLNYLPAVSISVGLSRTLDANARQAGISLASAR